MRQSTTIVAACAILLIGQAAIAQAPHATPLQPGVAVSPKVMAPSNPLANSTVKPDLPLKAGEWYTEITRKFSDSAPGGLGSAPPRLVTQHQCLGEGGLFTMTVPSLVQLKLNSCTQTGGINGTKVDVRYMCPGTTQYHMTGTITPHSYNVRADISSQDPRASYKWIAANGRWMGKCR